LLVLVRHNIDQVLVSANGEAAEEPGTFPVPFKPHLCHVTDTFLFTITGAWRLSDA